MRESAVATTTALTGRELEVLSMVALGEPIAAIGESLGIAEQTVKSHLASIYRKTGSHDRTQAVQYYLDHCVASPVRR